MWLAMHAGHNIFTVKIDESDIRSNWGREATKAFIKIINTWVELAGSALYDKHELISNPNFN